MATYKFTNNAFSKLTQDITALTTSIPITAGDSVKFPVIDSNHVFNVTLSDDSGNLEIVQVTSVVDDTFSVLRGQEGTTPREFSAGSSVQLRITAEELNSFAEFVTSPSDLTKVTGILDVAHGGTGNANGVAPSAIKATQDATGAEISTSYVHNTGNETVAGVKTFSSDINCTDDTFRFKILDWSKGDTPINNIPKYVGIFDNNDTFVSGISCTIGNDSSIQVSLQSHVNTVDNNTVGRLSVISHSDGSLYTTAITPTNTADNSTNIATTGWIRTATGNTTLNAATADNAVKWSGGSLTKSTAAPSGGANNDVWFQYI